MKTTVLLLAVLGCACAVPNGYYHQEYNYKTSSSEYKNNELQHKTDDQGYYKKDGDLEGRYKPRVDSNSEHSEYVNPNLKQSSYNTDANSYGHMIYDSTLGAGMHGNHLGEGLAHSDSILGNRNGYYGSQSSGYGGSHYSMSSNLRSISSRLQQECERDMLEAIRQNSVYGSGVNMAELERQLRHNLTQRFNDEIARTYGQQVIRDGKSYSLAGGSRLQNANFDNQEYMDLKNQLETRLLQNLRNEYYRSSSSNQHYSSSNNNYAYVTSTTRRPYYNNVYYTTPSTARPVYSENYHAPTYRPIYPAVTTGYEYSGGQYQSVQTHTRYTPVPNPESLTHLASTVQSRLDANLNNILDDVRRTHFSSNQAASLVNTDVLLDRLRNELRTNISYSLDDIIRQNYGEQRLKDGYLYSVGPQGQLSRDYNYGQRDLESLRQQIETNLINKLNRDFEQTRRSWSSQQSYSSQSSYGSSSNYGSNSNHGYGATTVATDYASGGQYIGEANGNIAQLQRQMQADLTKQLNMALSKEHSLQELSDELNRNLTRHFQEYSASGSYGAYGNFDRAQMADLKARLQDNLMQQLKQGLQQSFQTHSSYSASSASSSGAYRAARADDGYRSKRMAPKVSPTDERFAVTT